MKGRNIYIKNLNYRSKWDSCSKGELTTEFPLNIEMEPTYYCNLKCPACPRKINDGERINQHMKPEIWSKILKEMSENNLPSLQMDHEAESMMNPKFFDMLKEATKSGFYSVTDKIIKAGSKLAINISEKI